MVAADARSREHMAEITASSSLAAVEYPILYWAAEETARTAQRDYTRLVQIDLSLLVLGSALSVVGALAGSAAKVTLLIAAAIIIGLTIIVNAASSILHRDRDWVSGRAAAEAVKAATWRYMMRTEPFDGDDAGSHAQLIGALRAILTDHADLHLALRRVPQDVHQVPGGMRRVRALPFAERKAYYVRERLNDQVHWYLDKARHARRAATLLFWIDLIARAGALACAILVIVPPHYGAGVAGLLISLAAAATAWSQLGRYDEIGQSYSLTAQHLLMDKSTIVELDEQAFGRRVADVEETIAGEHGGWLSKRR